MSKDALNFSTYLTVKEAARFLGVAASTIRNWDRSGKLAAIRHPVNGYRLYHPAALSGLLGHSPADAEAPREAGSQRRKPRLAEPCSVLLIEDNARDAALILRALRRLAVPNPITLIADSEVALELLLTSPDPDAPLHLKPYGEDGPLPNTGLPGLILLDLRLPRIDGLEVLRRIRAHPRTRLIPVVALSALSDDKMIAEVYALGGNGYVVKAVAFDQLLEALQAICLFWLSANKSAPAPARQEVTG